MHAGRHDIYAGVEEGLLQATDESDNDSEVEPEGSAFDIGLHLTGDEGSGYVSSSSLE